MTNEVRHLATNGELLRFINKGQLYPVNQYQSLILAATSEFAALRLAAQHRRGLGDLAAWEVCCGGGPAAVTLKSLGVGRVQATDVSARSVESCVANATTNGVQLDRVAAADLLDDGEDRRYDLICCNPPCGPDVATPAAQSDAMDVAVRGGETGVELTSRLLDRVRNRLAPGGSLLFVAVSTADVARLGRQLDNLFSGQWRTFPTTPVAAPYRAVTNPSAAWLAEPDGFAPMVWRRDDGWFWRLTWVVEVTNDPAANYRSGFALPPYGYEVGRDPGLVELIEQHSVDGYWLDLGPAPTRTAPEQAS